MTKVVWSHATLRHVPSGGAGGPGSELPDRVSRIRQALDAEHLEFVEAKGHDDDVLLAVHDGAFVRYLETIYDDWTTSGVAAETGQDQVVPSMFGTGRMLGPLPGRPPTAPQARAGWFCYDTTTPVGLGTWEAARAAVDCALTAVDLVTDGARSAYALCRPPGHHAARSAYGGSCYLNNAAVAAEALRRAGHLRVAVIDIDAHHGNGTAAIFYDRADVFYGSVHVDPAAGWFPHVAGFADETGVAAGAGTTRNVPLAPGSGDGEWLRAVLGLRDAVASYRADALVVSLGVDAAEEDPVSPLRVTVDGYRQAGALLASLGLPTVHVQEGGSHLGSLGFLVAGVLAAFGAH